MKKALFTIVLLLYVSSSCFAATPEEAKAILNKKGISISESSLISNSQTGNTQTVQLLLDAGISPDARNQFGWTALMVALSANQQEVISALITAGADVNAKTKLGESPIYVAVLSGNADAVQRLIFLGANPHDKTKMGLSAYAMAKSLNRGDLMAIMSKGAARSSGNPEASIIPPDYPQISTKTSLIMLDEFAIAKARAEAPALKDINAWNRQIAYWIGSKGYSVFMNYAPLRYQLITPYSLTRFAFYKAGRQFKEPDQSLLNEIANNKNIAWVYLWGSGTLDYAARMVPGPPITNVVIRKNGVIYQPLSREQYVPAAITSLGVSADAGAWPSLTTSSAWPFPIDLFSKEGDFEIIAIDTEDHQKPLRVSAEDMVKFK